VYRVHISPSLAGWREWVSQWYDRSNTAAAATPVTIASAGETVRLQVTLERGGTISGTVRDASGPDSYKVVVTTAHDRAMWTTRSVSATGAFTVLGVPDGDWKVGAVRSAQFPEVVPPETVWFPNTRDWGSARIVTTRGFGDVTGIDIVMPAPKP
jgi:hypothetical protein